MRQILQLQGLAKRYGELRVTDGLDLTVEQGEVVGVIGPNGAGKSTLFNLVAGEVRPDAGRILLDGKDITVLPPHRRARLGIGRSSQIPRPFGGMTVFENLLVGAQFGAAGRLRDPASHCAEILAVTGLRDRADQPAGSLRLLDRKRLELARALSLVPRLLLLDEIAGGLAQLEAMALARTIAGVRATGVTILWVEHVLDALVPVATRLLVLASGRQIADGPPGEVLRSDAVRDLYLGREAAVR
jgi:branched-chain amino acid transport system ATP-binding protein